MEHTVLAIRADALPGMGTGHVMRCLAIAQEWLRQGGDVVFATCCRYEALRQRILDEGAEYVEIPSPAPDPSDLQTLRRVLEGRGEVRAVVVDGYHFDADYCGAIREMGLSCVVVDDFNHQGEYVADTLVNQNINAERLVYAGSIGTSLLGTRYAMLRREFLDHPFPPREAGAPVENVLITFGGEDPGNMSLLAMRAVADVAPGLALRVVVGSANPHKAELEREADRSPCPVELLHAVRDMPSLLSRADMCISAGGSTCWELCHYGIPSVLVAIADNQLGVVEGLAEHGAAVHAGWHADLTLASLSKTIEAVLGDGTRRLSMSRKGRELVDGKGAARIVWHVSGETLILREAREQDCDQYYRWANDATVREASFHSEPIPLESHVKWFSSRLASGTSFLYVGMLASRELVGQIRFDVSGETAEISISVDPGFRSFGIAQKLLRQGVEHFWESNGPMPVVGLVKKGNTASRRAFVKAGFVEEADDVHVSGHACRSFRMSPGPAADGHACRA